MEFSEAAEWRRLLCASDARFFGGSRVPLQRRCRLVDPEIDAQLFSVNELLSLSPERCPAIGSGATPVAEPLVPQMQAAVGADLRPLGLRPELQDTAAACKGKQVPIDKVCCFAASQQVEGGGREPQRRGDVDGIIDEVLDRAMCVLPVDEDKVGGFGDEPRAQSHASADRVELSSTASPPGHRRMRRSTPPIVEGGGGCAGCARSPPKPSTLVVETELKSDNRFARGDGGDSTAAAVMFPKCDLPTGAGVGALFVRRAPEAYARLEIAESLLMARIRQQANSEDRTSGADVGLLTAASHVAGLMSLGQEEGNKKVEVRVHLPPYGEDDAVLVEVPMRTTVAELRDEVVRLNARGGKIDGGVAYELRLYDEDEEEPDYDWAAFEEHLQVGCLGLREVALCVVGAKNGSSSASSSRVGSSTSSPRRRRSSSSDFMKRRGVEARREFGSLASASSNVFVGGAVGSSAASGGSAASAIGGAGSQRLFRADFCDKVEEDALAGRVKDASPRRSASRKNSAELSPLVTAAAKPSSWVPMAMEEATASGRAVALGGGAGAIRWSDNLQEVHPRPRNGSDSEVRDLLATSMRNQKLLSHRRTRSTPNHSNVTVGGSESFVAWPNTEGDSAAAHRGKRTTGVERLELRFMAPETTTSTHMDADDGELYSIMVREELTLYEVLDQLSRERRRAYDPVNLGFERVDADGQRHRVDLDVQVRHLLPHAHGPVLVVPKDGPLAPPDVRSRAATFPSGGCSVSRSSAFFFNEYTARVATEYLVTVAMRSSRLRPSECVLVVDRDRLDHRVIPNQKPSKRSSFMSPLLRKLGRHLHFPDTVAVEAMLFSDRRVCDVRMISCDENNQRAFAIAYACAGASAAGNGITAVPGGYASTVGTNRSAGGGGGIPGGSGGGSGSGAAGFGGSLQGTVATTVVELVYEAQTPTECAEIVARLRFLQSLSSRRQTIAK